MKPLAHNQLAAISFISLGLMSTGCGLPNSERLKGLENKISILDSKNLSGESKYDFLDTIINREEQKEEEDKKLFELSLKYEDYNIRVDRTDELSPWKLYATIYVNQRPHEIALIDSSLDTLEEQLSSEVISKKSDDIKALEKDFDITIEAVEKRGNTKFKVTDNSTGQKDTFKNIGDIKVVYTGLENNSAYIAKKAKTVKYLFRLLRGKDTHNKVLNLRTQEAGKALVIDGFDDMASALENSGLPKHLELSIKSSIYFLFGGAVFIGYEGANEEFEETKKEYAESIEETKKLRKELLTSMENEIAAKENLLKSIGVEDAALTLENKVAREVAMESARFKLEFAKEIKKALTKKKVQTSLNPKIFKTLVNLVQTHNNKIDFIKIKANEKLNISNEDYSHLFKKLKTVDSIKALSISEQSLVVDSINSLFEHQKNLNESLSKSIESSSILPNINRGLSSMFYGMVAFEAKTLSELLTLKSAAAADGIANNVAFQSYLTSVEAIGNTFLAAGQAQMVLAGLSKIGENASELKSLNSWLEDMHKSPFWDDVKNSHLDTNSKINILKTKKVLDSFYKTKRNWIMARSVGDTMLTAGQAAMFVSGPLLMGIPALSGVGAGSTILGIVTSQASDQYIGHSFEFDDPDSDSKEGKISSGELDNPNDPYFVKLLERSAKLVEHSHQKAQVRVWQKIYDKLMSSPNMTAAEIVGQLKSEWQEKKSKINAAKKDYYAEIYLKNLNGIFPTNNTETFNKNLAFISEAKILLNNASKNIVGESSSDSLKFIKFISSHLKELNTQVGETQNLYSAILIDDIKSASSNNDNSPDNIRSLFSFFDEFGLSGEFDRRIVKKIILQNGFPFASETSTKENKRIADRYIKEVIVKTNKQAWNIPNPLPGFFVYYFPQLAGSVEKTSKPLIFSKKDKSIYVFDKELFLNDLEKYNDLDQNTKKSVDEFTKLAFEVNDFNNSIDTGFFNRIRKIKGIFGRELRSVFKLTYDGVAKNVFRANTVRPITDGVAEQITNYNNINNIKPSKTNSVTSKILKTSYTGVKKFSSAANKYNVGMNFFLMPQTLNGIHQSVAHGDVAGATRGSLSFTINNADLAFDLARNVGGKQFWIKNPNSFKNIGSTQIVLNIASAGLDIWQAVELFKAAEATNNQRLKTDLYVNASLTTATAATSLGTALILPLTAKAGPIGAAIGFTIMFGQGTYNAVRTSEELRDMGFDEEYVVLNSISSFFGKYSTGEDARFITRKATKEIEETTIPEVMNANNKEFFDNMGKDTLTKSYYFKKIVFPKVSLYVPYTDEIVSLYCGYGVCGSSKVPPTPIENEKHMCLTNNSHFDTHHPTQLIETVKSEHLNSIQQNHMFLAKKTTPIPKSAQHKSFGGHGGISYFNPTTPCASTNADYPMVEKLANPSLEEIGKLKNIPESQKANLYLVGIGDQGKHGNMISSITAEKGTKNLFNIHPATHTLHLVGGDKEDIFEFYDYLQGIKNGAQSNGYIDGGDGIDTINLQGMPIKPKNEKMVVFLSKRIGYPSNFLEVRNIENVIGSNNDDVIFGSEFDNVLIGNDGDDSLHGEGGNDILYPGAGNDNLMGGTGSDVYVVLKKDISNTTEKIINNYDATFKADSQNGYDAIMTDIQNLVSQMDGKDLLLGFYENNSFIKAIRVKDYLRGEAYQHIVISDTKGNVYTTPSGLLFNEKSSQKEEDTYGENLINTINMKGYSPIVRIDEKIQYSSHHQSDRDSFKAFYISGNKDKLKELKQDTFNLNFKNVIGTSSNDVIFGDEQNNFLNGQGGIDLIKGHDGDDTISIELEPKIQLNDKVEISKTLSNYVSGNHEDFSRISGGKGHDTYILNLPKHTYITDETKPLYVEIGNRDPAKNVDTLIINDQRDTISNIYFSKISGGSKNNAHLKIHLFDSVEKKNYVVVIRKWFNGEEFRHMQIQVGTKLSIPESILNIVTSSLTDEEYYKSDEGLFETNPYLFNINDRMTTRNQKTLEVENKSYNLIEENTLPSQENVINFKYNITNNAHAPSNNHMIKFTRLENDLLIQFIPNGNENAPSFTILKDYYEKENFQNKNFLIKINEINPKSLKDFKPWTHNLSETEKITVKI